MAKKYEFRSVEDAEKALGQAKDIEEVAGIFGAFFGLPATLNGMEKYTAITDALDEAQGKPDAVAKALAVGTQALEQMAPNDAATAIRNLVKERFGGWMDNPGGKFPLAILRKEDAEKIGASVTVAAISAETMAKQKNHHPELTADDYALAQEAIEHGEQYLQNGKNLAFALNRPGGLVVIVKATLVGKEIYVVSLYHISHDDLEREKEIKRLQRGRKKNS